MEKKKSYLAENINENILWQDITPGGNVYESGTANSFITGTWRTEMPVYVEGNCKQCLLCVPVCPDSSIPVKDGKRGAFNMNHCKGCGVCAKVCPFKAINMIKDEK